MSFFIVSLRFYWVEKGAKRMIQAASGKMTDTSVTKKSLVLQASTIEARFGEQCKYFGWKWHTFGIKIPLKIF